MASDSTFECDNIPAEEGELLYDEYKKHGIAGILERLDEWRRVPLHIAVTGQAGAGKSTFINAIRGLKTGDYGAAHTNVTEGMKTIKSYIIPFKENIVFWDLPGVGTENFKRENYDDKVKLAQYDIFLILSSARFLENDGWLAKEIRKMDKRFYFVRTKVFLDIYNQAKCIVRDEILSKIRIDCLQNLKRHGISDSPVYLIDNFEPYDFDFSKLQIMLINDAPELKRETMTFSIIGRTQEVMYQKKMTLKKRIPIMAAVASGALHMPGFGKVIDVGLVDKEIEFYRDQFGLTEDAIKESARMLGVSIEQLKMELDMKSLTIDSPKKILQVLFDECPISHATGEVTKLVLPVIGSTIEISSSSICFCLTKFLEVMYQDSLKINMKLAMNLAQSSFV